MRALFITLAATAFVLAAASPAAASCAATPAVHVGTVSGEAEKDSVGLACATADVGRTGSIARAPANDLAQVGASTGEPEKDTLGYVQKAGAP